MCWSTFTTPSVKKANQGITIYKVLRMKDGNFFSYFQDFEYMPQKIYSIDNGLTVQRTAFGYCYSITEGFHSYGKKCYVMPCHSVDVFDIFSPSKQNTLSQYSNFRKNSLGCTVFAECIIPEGSTYFENERGEIVSDKIMLTGRAIQMSTIRDMILDKSKNNVFIRFTQLFDKLGK